MHTQWPSNDPTGSNLEVLGEGYAVVISQVDIDQSMIQGPGCPGKINRLLFSLCSITCGLACIEFRCCRNGYIGLVILTYPS